MSRSIGFTVAVLLLLQGRTVLFAQEIPYGTGDWGRRELGNHRAVITVHADADAVRLGSLAEMHGAQAVATNFKGKATAAKLALIDGQLGLAVVLGDQLRVVVLMEVEGDQIIAIDSIADPARIAACKVEYL